MCTCVCVDDKKKEIVGDRKEGRGKREGEKKKQIRKGSQEREKKKTTSKACDGSKLSSSIDTKNKEVSSKTRGVGRRNTAVRPSFLISPPLPFRLSLVSP